MRLRQFVLRNASGFSLAELCVAIAVVSLLGAIFFNVLQAGLSLSAKNTAVNAAHEEARKGILRMTRDLHASVSVPQIRTVDTTTSPPTFPVVSSTPSAGGTPPCYAGVSFQNVASGPNFTFQDAGTAIMIHDNPGAPVPGMRLILPFWNVEEDIATVSVAGTVKYSRVTTVRALPSTIRPTMPAYSGSSYAVSYYTDRVMYVVENGAEGKYVADATGDIGVDGNGKYVNVTPGTGQYHFENGVLNLYRQRYTAGSPGTLYWKFIATVARNLSSPRPFSVPLNARGSSDNKYVNVRISARDPKSTNRGYIGSAALLETRIDYRSRLTIYQ